MNTVAIVDWGQAVCVLATAQWGGRVDRAALNSKRTVLGNGTILMLEVAAGEKFSFTGLSWHSWEKGSQYFVTSSTTLRTSPEYM